MSKEAFLAVSKHFRLPVITLSSIFNYQGTYSRQYTYTLTSPEKLQRIAFAVKVPQKMLIANYCLALSHDPSTKVTTAFIHGVFLHTVLPTMRLSILSMPLACSFARHHQDYTSFQVPQAPSEITQSSHFISRLQSSISHWSHPILLPILLLQNYISRSNIFAWDLDDQVVALERQTGVVFAGRTVVASERSIDPEKMPRDKIKELTKDMHTLLTDIIFFERVVAWTVDCAAFLEKSLKEIDMVEVQGREINEWRRENREILEMLESIGTDAKSLCWLQKSLKERVQSQIGVVSGIPPQSLKQSLMKQLYSFVAQIDNSINAKIAVSSARDSSAMKTLALITTVFLPGTYIAVKPNSNPNVFLSLTLSQTLFSMSMFSWSQSSSQSDPSSVVSHRFWIYWAVTIPLTVLVIIIWRLWWLWQERSYQEDVKEAVGNSDFEILTTSSATTNNIPRCSKDEERMPSNFA